MEGGFLQYFKLYSKLRKFQKAAKPLLIGFVIVLCLVLIIVGCVVLSRSDPSNSGVSLIFSGIAIGLGFGMTLIYNKLACASFKQLESVMDTAASFVPG